jgi:hypothetical protein
VLHKTGKTALAEDETLSPMPEKPVSITQVQELLLQDLNASQFGTLKSTMTDETSFYEYDTGDICSSLTEVSVRHREFTAAFTFLTRTHFSAQSISPIRVIPKKGRGGKANETDVANEKTSKKRKRPEKRTKKTKENDVEVSLIEDRADISRKFVLVSTHNDITFAE